MAKSWLPSLRSSLATEPRLRSERGGAGLLAVASLLAVAVLGSFGLVSVTAGSVDATRARVAADLATLATLNWGPSVGAEVVLANGGAALTIDQEVRSATVEVRIGQAHASGRAVLAD
jgi:hypothetical protein